MKLIAALLLLFVTELTAHAQSSFIAKRIVFKNPGSFTQRQLEDAAGMHIGDKVDATVLGAAAQRLIDSGYFDNVSASFGGTAAIPVMNFDLKPTPLSAMLHTGFENFIWLSHEELEATIRAKVPLFIEYLPESSPQIEVIDTALTAALAAKGVTAHVAHETVEPTLAHPERTLEFRIDKPGLRITNVKLGGVTPDLTPLIQKSVNSSARTPYNEGLAGERTTDIILAPVLDAGYADASLTNITLAPSPAADGSTGVIVSGTLQAGDIYRVSHITFAGAPLVTPEAFTSTQKLHDGDIASRKALLETLAPLDAAYRRQGYMDVIVHSAPALDHAQHTVAYTVTVTPGQQYRIHEVKAENLDAAAQADFDRGFIMKQGELYNPEYVAGFLKNNTALRALAGYRATFKAYADPNNHTVDLVMTFYKGSMRQEITVH